MSTDEWALLSPRYFSDFFIWFFDGGWPARLLIIWLLFFGTLIYPGSRILWARYIKGKLSPEAPQAGPKLVEVLKDIGGDSTFYWPVFTFSLMCSVAYSALHMVWIQPDPAGFLTTGTSLQHLSNDDFRVLIRFLYQWVLTGYALAVLSLTVGLDSIARWMAAVRPPADSDDQTTRVLGQATTASRAAQESAHASRKAANEIRSALDTTRLDMIAVALNKPAFSLRTHYESPTTTRRDLDSRLLSSPDEVISLSTAGYFQPSSSETRLLRFEKVGDRWAIIVEQHHSSVAGLEFKEGRRGRVWHPLRRKARLDRDQITIRWQMNGATYWCVCERYVKI